jgi:head-tail adaptor
MAIQDYYYDIQHQRKIRTADGMGGYDTELTDLGTIQGTINQADSKEIQQAAQFNVKATHKLYTGISTDVRYDDLLVDKDGSVHRVVSLPKDTMRRGHHLKIYLEWTGAKPNG